MTSTRQLHRFSKGGSRTFRRPEFSVEVVVDIFSRSWADATEQRATDRTKSRNVAEIRFISFIGRSFRWYEFEFTIDQAGRKCTRETVAKDCWTPQRLL